MFPFLVVERNHSPYLYALVKDQQFGRRVRHIIIPTLMVDMIIHSLYTYI